MVGGESLGSFDELTPAAGASLETTGVVRRRRGRSLLVVAVVGAVVGLGIVTLRSGSTSTPGAVEPVTTTIVERTTGDGAEVRITVASGGWDWRPLELPAAARHVALDGDRVVAMQGEPTRLWIHDGGDWVERPLPPDTTDLTDPTGGWLVAADARGLLSASTDSGSTWTTIDLEAPATPSLMRADTVLGPAVRHDDELVVTVTRWRDLDGGAYLALVGAPLADDETGWSVDVFSEAIDVFGGDGEITRRVELDRNLLGPEALTALLGQADGQTTELIRIDPESGEVSGTLGPPGPTFGVASMVSLDGELVVTDWQGTRSALVDGSWVRRDEPSLGTLGGVGIDVRDGRLRVGPSGDRRPLSSLGLAFVSASADVGGVVAVTEPAVEPPLVLVEVPEGRIEFGLGCCATFITDDGTERIQLYQGTYSGRVDVTDEGWHIETETLGRMTISRDAWAEVLAEIRDALAGDGHGRVLATSSGTDWTLGAVHDLLGEPLPQLTPQVDGEHALLSGRALPETPAQFLLGEPGPLLAWIAELPS